MRRAPGSLFARTGGPQEWRPNSIERGSGLSMISVPTDAEGLEIRGIETMGGREVNDVLAESAP